MRKVVVLHIHYLETLECLLEYARAVDPDLLLITHTKEIESFSDRVKDFRDVKTYKVANRGRDIYPLVFLSKLNHFQQESIVWKMHSKRSLHLLRGHKWFKELCNSIAQDSKKVSAICELLSDPSIAMVGSKKYLKRIGKGTVEEHLEIYRRWNEFLSLSYPWNKASYISGTMFVCRSEVLERLARLELEQEDFFLEGLEVRYTRRFAFKLFAFNFFSDFGPFSEQRGKLDSLTRPASQTTYALEAYIGYIASTLGKVRGI